MKVVVILPRNMAFTDSGATSIDLIVRDQVQHSTFSDSSIVVGPQVQTPFDGIDYRGLTGNNQRQLNQSYLNEIQRIKPNIVVVHQYPKTACLLASKLPSLPVILYRHGLTKPRNNWFSRFRKFQQFKPVSKIIFVSEFIKSEFLRDYPTLTSKCEVLENAINTEFWKPSETKENIICYVGRALKEKGVIELIKGFQNLDSPDWGLELVVTVLTTREHEFYRQIKHEISGDQRITLRTNLSTNEVRELLSRSKIATLPSIVKEGFPRSVIEALSCGCATIASTSGGTPEVTGSAAKLLDVVTPDAILDTLNSLINDPVQIKNWGGKARKHAVKYLGIDSHIKKYDAILTTCTTG